MVHLFMKKLFKQLRQDNVTSYGFLLGGILILIDTITPIVLLSQLPPYLPLYNKAPWGYARLGTKFEFFIPIGIALICYIGNLFFAEYLYKKVPLLSRLLGVTTVVLMVLLTIFIIQTVRMTTF